MSGFASGSIWTFPTRSLPLRFRVLLKDGEHLDERPDRVARCSEVRLTNPSRTVVHECAQGVVRKGGGNGVAASVDVPELREHDEQFPPG